MQNLVIFDDLKHFGEKIELNESEAHVWLFSKHAFVNDISRFFESLPSQERQIAFEFKKEECADRFILRHGLLRALLQMYLPIKNIELSSTPKHKLYLKNVKLQFNCSSSEDYFAFAFSKEMRMGVDIEVIRPLLFVDEMIEDCFCLEEQSYLRSGEKLRKFFEIWTNKEAVLKAVGMGIIEDLSQVDCVSDKGEAWTLIEDAVVKKPVWLCSLKRWEELSLSIALT